MCLNQNRKIAIDKMTIVISSSEGSRRGFGGVLEGFRRGLAVDSKGSASELSRCRTISIIITIRTLRMLIITIMVI